MPDIGHIGPICSNSNDHLQPRSGVSTSRITLGGDEDRTPRSSPSTPKVPTPETPLETPEDRHQRIEEIRRSIRAGTYPSEEKLQLAMKRMIDELSH